MQNLKLSSIKQPQAFLKATGGAQASPKWLVALFLILSGSGFLDASYLTIKHYVGTPINCSFLNGCDTVTTSSYSMIFGLPVALLGVLYYLTVFMLVMLYIDTGRKNLFYGAALITPLGLFASLWFVYLQVFVIHALCLYCLVSAFISTLLFCLGFFILTLKSRT